MSSADFSLTTFSPSGKLVQIEYALNAVQAGRTSLGIKATNGVVIASEKKIPSILVDAATVDKTGMLSSNVGVTYSGMGPDFRVLLNKGRKAAQSYYLVYKDVIPVTLLARELAAVMQEFTQSGGVRPFGVSLLVAGYDDEGPQLYQVSTHHTTATTAEQSRPHAVVRDGNNEQFNHFVHNALADFVRDDNQRLRPNHQQTTKTSKTNDPLKPTTLPHRLCLSVSFAFVSVS